MQTRIIHDCTRGALEGRTSFLDTVKALRAIAVERYYADLVRLEKVFYARDGETTIERLPISDVPQVADAFDEAGLIATLRSVQQRQIDYPEFLRQSLRAGCVSYVVYLDGGMTAYFGRRGETYIEKFPAPML